MNNFGNQISGMFGFGGGGNNSGGQVNGNSRQMSSQERVNRVAAFEQNLIAMDMRGLCDTNQMLIALQQNNFDEERAINYLLNTA